MKIKKSLCILLSSLVLVACIMGLLNIETTTRQGVNHQWHTMHIPLYLKILNFYDRHFNYKYLAKKITKDVRGEEEKVKQLFAWTYENIRPAPRGYPIIDDHVWHIIVRGYGTADQACDVFSTLCNYVGVDACFKFILAEGSRRDVINLSFVKLNEKWTVFDPYNGVYFKNSNGEFASTEQIRAGDWIADSGTREKRSNLDYAKYLKDLPRFKAAGLTRSTIQSPLKRLLFEIKKKIE